MKWWNRLMCRLFGHRWCAYGLWEDKCLRCDKERRSTFTSGNL